VSWAAHLQHTETGLAIVFAGPVSRLDLTPEVAEHFASLIAIEARHRLRGIVSAVENIQNLNDSALRHAARQSHPLCCDCDTCLNGGTA